MPFTPFHLGPGILLGLIFRKRLNLVAFIIANVVIDIEPFIVVLLRLSYSLHCYLHTFLFASIMGFSLGYLLYVIRGVIGRIHRLFFDDIVTSNSLSSYVLAGVIGSVFHVLLDFLLYYDINPFFPILDNPYIILV